LILVISLSLQLKRTQLLGAKGGVQKIKSAIRALVQFKREVIDINQYNKDNNPTKILKFFVSQVASYQDLDMKPEHVLKIIKRLKGMVRMPSYHASSNDDISELMLNLSFNILHIQN
jgi:hypothetical protein